MNAWLLLYDRKFLSYKVYVHDEVMKNKENCIQYMVEKHNCYTISTI